ncbi:MAG: hypothetical protein M3220_04915, partial [Chloroflexota bacterium]|nr:hypothetical protein [Chloroflexota bacterium]
MPVTRAEIRHGVYYDSIVLMQLQGSLAAMRGVLDAGVMMGTAVNKEILAQSNLLTENAQRAGPDDLVIVVRAGDERAAEAALREVDSLLGRRESAQQGEYRPQSLEVAAKMMPEARWVVVSVPGRYAADVAREALRLGKHVFLYSDNVSLEDEISLKQDAAQKQLLVMGPDCGTAIINGVGLGFANRARRGPIGLVAASGTGLQAVAAHIHELGSGISHAIGTGGRDLSREVDGLATKQALDLLVRDPETKVIVLVGKPPAPEVADAVLDLAQSVGKPVVIDFIGYSPPLKQMGNIYFATTLDEASTIAVRVAEARQPLTGGPTTSGNTEVGSGDETSPSNVSALRSPLPAPRPDLPFAPGQRYLRALFSGGTLAYEALLLLSRYVPP